jgi:hypothetical protein
MLHPLAEHSFVIRSVPIVIAMDPIEAERLRESDHSTEERINADQPCIGGDTENLGNFANFIPH